MEEHPKHDRVITVSASPFVHNHADNSLRACISHTNLAITVHNALPGPLLLPLIVVFEQSQTTDLQVRRRDSHSSDWYRKSWQCDAAMQVRED